MLGHPHLSKPAETGARCRGCVEGSSVRSISANFVLDLIVSSTFAVEPRIKAPSEKGDFRRIFSTLDKKPPCPP